MSVINSLNVFDYLMNFIQKPFFLEYLFSVVMVARARGFAGWTREELLELLEPLKI